MRINELRIGNYIECNRITETNIGRYHDSECLEITSIDYEDNWINTDTAWSFHGETGCYVDKPNHYIAAIPLSDDIAILFGYECLVEMACDFCDKSKYFIEITRDDLLKLKAHEAQNLYHALTFNELTLK